MSRARASIIAGLLGAAGMGGCAARVAPRAVAPALPLAGTQVEKVREQLQVTPWDLVFCAARGSGSVNEGVSARNIVDETVEVRAIFVTGEDAALFQLGDLPPLPAALPSKERLSVAVTFAPPVAASLGVHRALLRFQTGPTPDDGPGVDLAALVTRDQQEVGVGDDDEPPLQQVVEALGFSINLGEIGRGLGLADQRTGDEIEAPLFRRASPAPVAVNPVARFSADGPRSFGHYAPGGAPSAGDEMAQLVAGQSQTLNPDLAPGGQTSFDPGEGAFGLWVKIGQRIIYSEDGRNGGAARHAARVYPLRARGGAAVANAYLVAFDDLDDGDYQDGVFVLWNVKPAATAATAAAAAVKSAEGL
jgi:hypothetical protein